MDINIDDLQKRIERAALAGAQIIATPETCSLIEPDRSGLVAKTYTEAQDPALAMLRAAARCHQVMLLVGSLIIQCGTHLLNRSYVIGRRGDILAHYDKLHLFDVALGGGETYRESDSFQAGARAVVARTELGNFGLSICYDLRFPQLYRALAQGGAQMLNIPAAFTQTTGRAHWSVLLRARAIETGSFVIAAAQCGLHGGGRRTYGHSMIISPWGEVLAELGEVPGECCATIDLSAVAQARERIPAWAHERAFDVQIIDPDTD